MYADQADHSETECGSQVTLSNEKDLNCTVFKVWEGKLCTDGLFFLILYIRIMFTIQNVTSNIPLF